PDPARDRRGDRAGAPARSDLQRARGAPEPPGGRRGADDGRLLPRARDGARVDRRRGRSAGGHGDRRRAADASALGERVERYAPAPGASVSAALSESSSAVSPLVENTMIAIEPRTSAPPAT